MHLPVPRTHICHRTGLYAHRVSAHSVNRIHGRRLLRLPADHLPKLRVQKWDDIKLIIAEIKKLRAKVAECGIHVLEGF